MFIKELSIWSKKLIPTE